MVCDVSSQRVRNDIIFQEHVAVRTASRMTARYCQWNHCTLSRRLPLPSNGEKKNKKKPRVSDVVLLLGDGALLFFLAVVVMAHVTDLKLHA